MVLLAVLAALFPSTATAQTGARIETKDYNAQVTGDMVVHYRHRGTVQNIEARWTATSASFPIQAYVDQQGPRGFLVQGPVELLGDVTAYTEGNSSRSGDCTHSSGRALREALDPFSGSMNVDLNQSEQWFVVRAARPYPRLRLATTSRGSCHGISSNSRGTDVTAIGLTARSPDETTCMLDGTWGAAYTSECEYIVHAARGKDVTYHVTVRLTPGPTGTTSPAGPR